MFSPEFLREGQALYDNLYPSRIIVGDNHSNAKIFAKVLHECSNQKDNKIQLIFMNSSEAEAVKLFANTFLAMRIAYFNELDSYCESFNLMTENVIKGLEPHVYDKKEVVLDDLYYVGDVESESLTANEFAN